MVGGTSLATPLTAAFEALTGVGGSTPAWAYENDASLLNDIVSGSDGACPSGALLICNAAAGWDGPTGNGSISGEVITGAPGIGGSSEIPDSTDSTTADVTSGLYPNSLETTYWWEYGTSTSYGETTPTVDTAGSSLEAVNGSLTGLVPCTTYHYRLDATNTPGANPITSYGYDNTFTAAVSAPDNAVAPTITGTVESGQQLSADPGTWSASNCGAPSVAYQWQESANQNGPFNNIWGANSSTYTPTSADASLYITVAVTETNGGGSQTVNSPAVGPVVVPTPTPPAPPTPSPPSPPVSPITTVSTPTTTTPAAAPRQRSSSTAARTGAL